MSRRPAPLVVQLLEAAQHNPADAASGLTASRRTLATARRAVADGADPARAMAQTALIAAALLEKLPTEARGAFLQLLRDPTAVFIPPTEPGR